MEEILVWIPLKGGIYPPVFFLVVAQVAEGTVVISMTKGPGRNAGASNFVMGCAPWFVNHFPTNENDRTASRCRLTSN